MNIEVVDGENGPALRVLLAPGGPADRLIAKLRTTAAGRGPFGRRDVAAMVAAAITLAAAEGDAARAREALADAAELFVDE